MMLPENPSPLTAVPQQPKKAKGKERTLFEGGFIQLELLAAALLLGLVANALLPKPQSWLHFYHKAQLQATARLLAADLRHLQSQITLNHRDRKYVFYPNQNGKSYTISSGQTGDFLQNRNFERCYCSEVYMQNTPILGFSPSGSPTFTGALILKHRQLTDYFLTVELQPVSGRVLIHEN